MDKFDASSPRRAQVDAKAVRRQVRSILHRLDRMRSSEAYWHVGAVANEVRQLLEQGWKLITLARALYDRGEREQGLQIAEEGLLLQGPKGCSREVTTERSGNDG